MLLIQIRMESRKAIDLIGPELASLVSLDVCASKDGAVLAMMLSMHIVISFWPNGYVKVKQPDSGPSLIRGTVFE